MLQNAVFWIFLLIFCFSLLKYTYYYNYRSHISLQAVKLAKSAGVQILIFPTVHGEAHVFPVTHTQIHNTHTYRISLSFTHIQTHIHTYAEAWTHTNTCTHAHSNTSTHPHSNTCTLKHKHTCTHPHSNTWYSCALETRCRASINYVMLPPVSRLSCVM